MRHTRQKPVPLPLPRTRAPTPTPPPYLTPPHTESTQKTQILTNLHHDCQSLHQNEHQFQLLKQQYNELNNKYKLQLEEKNLLDEDFRNRHQGAQRHIGQLKNQVEAIRGELRDKRLEIEDLAVDGDALKGSVDQRTIQMEKLRIQVNSLLCDSQQLQSQRQASTTHLQHLRTTNTHLHQSLLTLQSDTDRYNTKTTQLQTYQSQLHTESQILTSKIKDYEDSNNQLDNEIQAVLGELSGLENQIAGLQAEMVGLQKGNAQLGGEVEGLRGEGMRGQRAVQGEVMRNNDLGKRLRQAQNTLRVRSAQVQQGNSQLATLHGQNQHLQQTNNQLLQDLQACKTHLQNLNLLNHQLLTSLQNFSEQDKRAAELITREKRVRYLAGRVEETSSIQFYGGGGKDTARTDVSLGGLERSRGRFRG